MRQGDTRTRSIAWGILGTGAIAGQFCADLARLPGARVAGICSRSPDKAEAFRRRVGAERAFSDLDGFLADPAVDIIYIATPSALHAEQACLALAAGKPLLVEKPLATSAADARRIAAQAASGNLFAMEAMWTRFLPAVTHMRAEIARGAIGEITRIQADLSFKREERAGGRFFDRELGGGAALDLGVYPVSLALHLLGAPADVSGRWRAARSGVDIRTDITLHYPRATAELSCGFDRDGDNFFLVEGTRGAIRLEAPFLKAQRVSTYSPAALRLPLLSPHRSVRSFAGKALNRLPLPGRRIQRFAFEGNGLQFQAIAAMDAIREGRTQCPTMPLAESASMLDAIEAVLSQPPQ